MITAEQDYALVERARGMALEMYALLSAIRHAAPWIPVEDWQQRAQDLIHKIEGTESN